MLRCCVLDSGSSWESYLAYVEFVYNNSYQASIGMAPYEALYGRPCRSPLCWREAGESHLVGPDIVRTSSESVSAIRRRLVEATDKRIEVVRQNRQKRYADIRLMDLEFQVGDYVYLRVAARKA